MTPVRFVVAIPARYAASRLPGKPLRPLGGRPLVLHVVERALEAGAEEVVLATDDSRVADAVQASGVRVCMTRADHASGTDRLAEVARLLDWPADRIVVNLQGDEPFAPPEGIRAVAARLQETQAPMATLYAPFRDTDTAFDPNAVKLVADGQGHALYFSRAPLPWFRDRYACDRVGGLPTAGCRHIGIYAYRAGFLQTFAGLPQGRLEAAEALEQLRVIEAGYRIAVAETPVPFPPGVDTPDDLARAEALLATR